MVLCLSLTSCSSTFYQLYEVEPQQNISKEEEGLVYEDEHCIITYNLWAEEGDSGFTIYNKTQEKLTLHLDESFFILNDRAYDYYKNRITSSSRMTTATSSYSNSMALLLGGYGTKTSELAIAGDRSVAAVEKPKISIPPQSSKRIAEYIINPTLFRSCNLFRYPSRKQVNSETFNETNSPIVFKNLIKYQVNGNDELKTIEHTFYVSAISNYPESEFKESKYEEFCGSREPFARSYFVKYSSNRFYIKYEKPKSRTTAH